MRNGKTVLAQMQELISRYNFEKVVFMHNGDKGVKKFKTHNLLTIMLYAQMTAKMSLRDICYGLKSKMNYWYHLSINSISRNNLSHALSKRPAEMFESIFYQLLFKLKTERGLINDKRFKFKNSLRSIDSTTISLCLSLFEWAKFRRAKGGIKLHTMFNNKEQVPEFIIISEAKEHDINIAYDIPIQEGAIYVMDKAYMCYDFLEKIRENRAFFVTRTKKNTLYKIIERRKKTGVGIRADWTVEMTGSKVKDYSGQLRVVRYYDSETKRTYEYYTNNFNLSAKAIADIYKSRWDIEIFFEIIIVYRDYLKLKISS